VFLLLLLLLLCFSAPRRRLCRVVSLSSLSRDFLSFGCFWSKNGANLEQKLLEKSFFIHSLAASALLCCDGMMMMMMMMMMK